MQKDRLAEHLRQSHLGSAKAATSRELERTFSVTGKDLRQLVNGLRRDGVPIASDGSGYYYAATEQEVRATIAHLTRRISGIAAAIHGLNRSLELFDDAQVRLPLQDSTQSPAQAGLRGTGGAREQSGASPAGGAERRGLCDDGGDGL